MLFRSIQVAGNANIANARITGAVTAIGNIVAGNFYTVGTGNVGTLYVGAGGASINGYTKVTGNMDITGNVNVTGNVNYSNVTELVVGDPLIYVADENPGDAWDIGIVGAYVTSSVHKHTGIARNHTNGTWTFFTNLPDEPTTEIGRAHV